jgi:LDH2 family malate/lactate/ureidoglycolate dehydrogenase
LYQRVVTSERRQDFDRIYFPGEIEQINQDKREVEGIPYTQSEVDALNKEAETAGVALLTT